MNMYVLDDVINSPYINGEMLMGQCYLYGTLTLQGYPLYNILCPTN